MAREDFRCVEPLRVRWAEADIQGVVFNAHYLTYFDVGVTEYFRALTTAWPEPVGMTGEDMFVAHAELDYHAPARFDDLLDICVRVRRLGRTSIEWCIEIHRDDEHLITGKMIHVHADMETGKPAPLPGAFREAVTAFEAVPPEF